MNIELNFREDISLMEFLGDSQYDELEIRFDGLKLFFYPTETIIPKYFYSDNNYGIEGKEFEILFDAENPFESEELRFEDEEWIFKNYDDLYPIIKAMNVHLGLLDSEYDGDIIINADNDLRFDNFIINVSMDYLDGKYSIRDVKIIKDLLIEED